MAKERQTLGQAIDSLIEALEPLDSVSRVTALAAVCGYLQIEMSESQKLSVDRKQADMGATPAAEVGRKQKPEVKIDIRNLKEQKQPKNARQMACLVAYYLQELTPVEERKETVNAEDLEKYFKQAGFKLPQKIRQVLPDAKGAGYFDSVARGEYKLNAVGYNLVAHNLPLESR